MKKGISNLKNLKHQGFTLVEMIVAITIFLVILIMTMANIKSGNQKSELRLTSLRVASEIRDAQGKAFAAFALPIAGVSPRVYGVHFVKNSRDIILFAKPPATTGYLYEAGVDEILKTTTLGENFIISGMNEPEVLSCGGVKVVDNEIDIVFTVPRGHVYFNGRQPDNSCGSYNPARITLSHSPTTNDVIIEVNWISGQVSTTGIN